MSEKPFDTLALPLRDSLPTLLLDENLSSSSIAEFLKRIRREWVIELCIDHLPRGTSDPDVIKLCGERGWVLVTCDERIRYVPENKAAVIRNRVKAVMFNKGNLQGVEYAAALIVGRSHMLKTIQSTVGHLISRINRSGEFSVLEPKQAEATTAREKTKKKYGDKVFDKPAVVNED
jgi:hypothetical protein